jgi:AraC family transcriptional regulator, regulatory protein of adaptative response / DNA-3-methyladenine glycosylase II
MSANGQTVAGCRPIMACMQAALKARNALSAPNELPAAPTELYRAMLSRDARFDGRFFVGVLSTGVYCRPVCRVRTPLARNCRFFGHAAGAEQAGFRPCLLCRPELAPGLARHDAPAALAQAAARWLDRAAVRGEPTAMSALSERLGVSERHLRRIFQASFGVAPLAYLQTRRLLLAKQLLTDTALSAAEVAGASGFGSVRSFNAAFARHYRLQPRVLRRRASASAASAETTATTLQARLAYRPPYDLAGSLAFLRRRAVAGLEAVQGQTVAHTLVLDVEGQRRAGWVCCRFNPERHELALELPAELAGVLGEVISKVRHWLDLDADPDAVATGLADVPGPAVPGLRLLAGGLGGFEIAARVVLGQQVSTAAARTLTARLVQRFGLPLAAPCQGLTHGFPDAAVLAAASTSALCELGLVRQRAHALQALATAVDSGSIELHPAAPLAPTLQALRALPGIGEWTVQLIAMRALAWPDAFAAQDVGLYKALGSRDPRAIAAQAAAWSPWRAYAQMQLWHSLETST